jgi:predicted transcriptional regulator
MFEKCITCNRIGESCVPNLMLLSFSDLMAWAAKRQKQLGWTNQTFADKSNVPVGTINRIKGGDYIDCKYSTMRHLLIALIGGTTDEFACTEMVERELQQMERELRYKEELEQIVAKLSGAETENKEMKEPIAKIDEIHRNDIRAIKEEYQEQIAFLKEQLKAWQTYIIGK